MLKNPTRVRWIRPELTNNDEPFELLVKAISKVCVLELVYSTFNTRLLILLYKANFILYIGKITTSLYFLISYLKGLVTLIREAKLREIKQDKSKTKSTNSSISKCLAQQIQSNTGNTLNQIKLPLNQHFWGFEEMRISLGTFSS